MGYTSDGVTKLQYAKYLAAALAYLASRQHDPVGLIVFDEEVRQYRAPASRAGSLQGMIHAIDAVEAGRGTDLVKCFSSFREHLTRRGLVAVISDLYCDPEAMSRAVQPLGYHGHDIMIFQLLDPQEVKPHFEESVVLEDVETQSVGECVARLPRWSVPRALRCASRFPARCRGEGRRAPAACDHRRAARSCPAPLSVVP